MHQKPFIQESLRYLQLGWGVLPIKPGKKHPPFAWSEWKRRLASEEEVILWEKLYPNSEIGIVTGRVSGILVVDADGAAGRRSLEKLHLLICRNPIVMTPSGGWHVYFEHPETSVPNRVKSIRGFPGLDIRSDGGLVVAPGSPGSKYEWLVDPEIKPVPLPENFLAEISKPQNIISNVSVSLNRSLVMEDGFFCEGSRNRGLFEKACGYARSSQTYDHHKERLRTLNQQQCKPPLPDSEVEIIARNSWRYKAHI